jgi:hypothetical protein
MFDERVSERWIEEILEPFVQEEKNTLLLVDHHRAQFLGLFFNGCNDLSIEMDCSPTGFTCVGQAVDVGFYALFKQHGNDRFRKCQTVEFHNPLRLPSPKKYY